MVAKSPGGRLNPEDLSVEHRLLKLESFREEIERRLEEELERLDERLKQNEADTKSNTAWINKALGIAALVALGAASVISFLLGRIK